MQGLRREELHPGGSKLDRQREAVDTRADAGDGWRVLVGHMKVRLDGESALDEELHRLVLGERLRGRLRARVGKA